MSEFKALILTLLWAELLGETVGNAAQTNITTSNNINDLKHIIYILNSLHCVLGRTGQLIQPHVISRAGYMDAERV